MTDQDLDKTIRNLLIPAMNNMQEQIAHLTAAVEYAAGRMPQESFQERIRQLEEEEDPYPTKEPDAHAAPAQDASRYPDDDPDVGYPGQAASYLLANIPEPFDLTGMRIHLEGETLVIDTSGERFEPTDEWQEWTSEHFGKGKLGSIEWQDVGDTEEVWVPQAFKLPLAEFDEVFDDG